MALDNLISAINQFSGVSENTTRSIDTDVGFGALGEFANKIDKSAHRQYIESGYIRNVRPRQSEVLMQEPDMTILVKKRMFSSLVENFKPELMDAKEKLFFRATKKMFQNKCSVIAAYERLSKIDRVIKNNGVMNDFMLPLVFSGLEVLDAAGINIMDAKTRSIMESLKKVKAYSDPNYRTTWVVESELPALSDLGDGTGVIELTNVASMNCTTSVMFGAGSGSITIEDPYKLLIVTNEDIDQAIRESSAGFLNNAFFKVTQAQLEATIDDLRAQLTSIRRLRGATAIRFFINEDTLLFRKVRAVIDEEGREILFSYDGGLAGIGSDVEIDSSSLEGTNGLDTITNEISVFKQILKNIYLLMGLKKSTQVNNFEFNQETNYVRRKMRLHFGNKPIIQPMDVLHVFVSTKSVIDSKSASVVSGSLDASTILNSINDTIGSIEDMISSLSGSNTAQGFALAEKDAIAGPDFPMWLWSMVKNDFTRQAAGTHVFAGVVQKATHDYSGGKYVLNVNASDNCSFFKFGQININPSVEVFNSELYDPLTPYDLDFDASSGFLRGETPALLQENVTLLNSGILKFKNGRFRGYPANEQIYGSFDVEKIQGSSNRASFRRKYEDPDGLVYRWKEGIQTKTLMGEPHPTTSLPQDTSPNLRKNPFAGQDVMNVLSLLIAGLPYNFNTFMKASIDSGALTRDDLLNDNGSKSFFRGLLADISKQNATWGNFIPFKKLIINESAYSFLRSGQFDIIASNRKITELLRERARRFDQLVKIVPAFANNPQFLNVDSQGRFTSVTPSGEGFSALSSLDTSMIDPIAISKLGGDIIKLDFEIEQARMSFEKSIQTANINTTEGAIQIFGDDVSFDPTVNQSETAVSQTDIIRQRSEFRKKINYLTQRRLWRVKANEDPNLFIVDDSYDKNYDVQAFEKGLAGSLDLFKSTYTNPGQQIEMVASLLGLEVFADSQGHIQARPPQYNRMPSSVFYKMIDTKNITGVQLFPPYLESLFTNQIKGLAEKIEILEDEIRIRAAALGYVTDQKAKTLLSGLVSGGGNTNFAFVTTEIDGKFGGKDIRVFLDQVNPDLTGSDAGTALKAIGTALGDLTKKIQTAKAGVNFDIVQRIKVVNQQELGAGSSEKDVNAKITIIGERLRSKTGKQSPTKESLLSNFGQGKGASQLDVLNLTQQIAQLLSDRQSAIKLLANATKNLGEGIDLNTSTESGQTALLPFLNKTKAFPQILEHMIEDEDIDDLGYRSGKRYVIQDNQILSLQIVEEPPQHTVVEVSGLFGEGLAEPPGGFETGGGNPFTTAWAVDFDMWRMYGFRSPQTVQAPFLSNPDTQCAPYAVFLLNKARKEIFQGEITIAGNEFIQPGEVYYIEDRDLLFYTEQVKHSFNYGAGGGGTFTTSMSLKYGHNPGEYIPTILDIIGKGLYTNKHQADLARHNRHGTANGDVHVSTIIFDNRDGISIDPLSALVSGSYGDQNRKSLANTLLAASGALTPTTFGRKARIELRTYFDSQFAQDATLNSLVGSIKNWIINPTKTNISGDSLLPDESMDQVNNVNVDSDSIVVTVVDLSNKSDGRSPSQAAINRAKEIVSTSGTSTTDTNIDPIKSALYTRIVDIWVTFEAQDQTSQISKTPEQAANQAAQENLAQTLAAFNAKLKSQTD